MKKVLNLDDQISSTLQKLEKLIDNPLENNKSNISEIVNKCQNECDTLLGLLKSSFKIDALKSFPFIK